jgi:phage baseplate assembly protein W
MSDRHERFGADLRLLRNLDRIKSNRDPGNDLSVVRRDQTGQIDLEPLSGVDNLIQALLLRFLTPAGELTALGHPDYGSRLHELIGELNTETNRNRAKLFVLQSLEAEPRVKKALSVQVTQNRRDPAQMDIDVTLLAIDSDTPINLVFPFFLEGGATS